RLALNCLRTVAAKERTYGPYLVRISRLSSPSPKRRRHPFDHIRSNRWLKLGSSWRDSAILSVNALDCILSFCFSTSATNFLVASLLVFICPLASAWAIPAACVASSGSAPGTLPTLPDPTRPEGPNSPAHRSNLPGEPPARSAFPAATSYSADRHDPSSQPSYLGCLSFRAAWGGSAPASVASMSDRA